MERVKQFLEEFLMKEANVADKIIIPNLESYSIALNEYYSYLVVQLQGATGYMPMNELRDDEFYEACKGYPKRLPRFLYKISEYTHEKYGKVWAAYVSQENPITLVKRLNNIILLIEENNQLKIARFLMYSNYTEYGHQDAPYKWKEQWGYRDLSLESLVGPIHIERYLEPSEKNDGLKMYLENK